MGKLYIGSSLHNKHRISELISTFHNAGVSITYDWTTHGQVFDEDELFRLGLLEEQGVIDCDIFLLVLPGRNGSHFEFGIARALGKHIVILEEVEVEKKTFYYLPGIQRFDNERAAVEYIVEFLNKSEQKEMSDA
jgi:hypothetical protein